MGRVCLGIDTAGPVVGLALWMEGETRALFADSQRVTRGADAWMGGRLCDALALADAPDGPCAGRGLDLVAVSTGPGAFTGLRVGVSIALGLSVSREIPVVGLSSLMVRAARHNSHRVLALLDARKGRVYAGLYDSSGLMPQPGGLEVDAFLSDVLSGPVGVATGEGAEVRRSELEAAGWRVVDQPCSCPAESVARLGLSSEVAGTASELQLRYIRAPDAKKPSTKERAS